MPKEETEFVGARLPKALVDLARLIGKGNISAGIREALQRYNRRRPTDEEVNAAIATLAQMQEEDVP